MWKSSTIDSSRARICAAVTAGIVTVVPSRRAKTALGELRVLRGADIFDLLDDTAIDHRVIVAVSWPRGSGRHQDESQPQLTSNEIAGGALGA
jgi:hypothetical protein